MISAARHIMTSRITQSLIYWVISFAICLQIFSRADEILIIDYIYVFLFHIPFFVVVTLNTFSAIPYFLKRYGIWVYLIMIIPFYGLTVGLYQLAFGSIAEFLFPSFYFVAIHSPLELFGIMMIYLVSSSLIEFSKSWFKEKEAQLEIAKLEDELSKNELRLLKAQINPHFLFNTLNSIYGEALQKSDKAPKMILTLSEMLRYVVDNIENEQVPLEDELSYITNYVELQKSRLSHPNRVNFSCKGDASNYTIVPLLLINFVENCFKHGTVSGLQDFIDIELTVQDRVLRLNTKNSVNTTEITEPQSDLAEIQKVGFHNTVRRLEAYYQDNYELNFEAKSLTYELTLTVQLS